MQHGTAFLYLFGKDYTRLLLGPHKADFLNMVLVITNTKVIPKVKFGFLKPFWSSLVLVKSKKWAQNIGTLV